MAYPLDAKGEYTQGPRGSGLGCTGEGPAIAMRGPARRQSLRTRGETAMTLARTLLLVVAAAAALGTTPAAAQWAWRDAAGRMVYSDQPPPKSVPARDILKQPVGAPARPASTEPASEAAGGATAAATKPAAPAAP